MWLVERAVVRSFSVIARNGILKHSGPYYEDCITRIIRFMSLLRGLMWRLLSHSLFGNHMDVELRKPWRELKALECIKSWWEMNSDDRGFQCMLAEVMAKRPSTADYFLKRLLWCFSRIFFLITITSFELVCGSKMPELVDHDANEYIRGILLAYEKCDCRLKRPTFLKRNPFSWRTAWYMFQFFWNKS